MNWLTNFVRPRIQALVSKTEVPENLWEKCPGCEQMLFHRELDANLRVCQQANAYAMPRRKPAVMTRSWSPRA
jgi:acetyl-CoA carboxylase beta subunit